MVEMEYCKYSPFSISEKLIELLFIEYSKGKWYELSDSDKREMILAVKEDIVFSGRLKERIKHNRTTRSIVKVYFK
jgi:hypothetical protein